MTRLARNRPSLLLAALLSLTVLASAQDQEQILYQKDSLYHRIFVSRQGDIVTLRFRKRQGRIVQSRIDQSDLGRHMLEYTTLTMSALLYNPEPRNILILGLGGGVLPRRLRYHFPDAHIDVAEIDAEVPDVAQRFFHFRTDDHLAVHVADGRVFIRKLRRKDPVPKYDLVILDAFTGDYIPFHLMTAEFLQEVQSILSDDGVVAANVFYTNRLFDAELATFLHVFDRCQVFRGSASTNAILVAAAQGGASLTPDQARERAERLQLTHHFPFDVRNVAAALDPDVVPHRGAPVLTDDRAPVNWLRDQDSPDVPPDDQNTPSPDDP